MVYQLQQSYYQPEYSYWEELKTVYTDANGYYIAGGLTASRVYRILFRDPQDEYAIFIYDGAPNIESATDLEAPANNRIEHINASLSPAASISGTVTGPDGSTSLEGILVTATYWTNYGPGSYYQTKEASTDAAGNYTISGLSPGTYVVDFLDPILQYCPEDYDDIVNAQFNTIPTHLFLTNGMAVAGIDASLTPAGVISGTVTGPDGSALLSRAYAEAYRWNGASWVDFQYTSAASSDGTYALRGLETGIYRVSFILGNYCYIQTYDNTLVFDDGVDIALPAGGTVSKINASLVSSTGSICGKVTAADNADPLADITVSLSSSNNWQTYETDLRYDNYPLLTDTDGCYSITGLPEGDYYLRFHDANGYYAGTQYEDNGSESVNVPPGGGAVSNVNAALLKASSIAGTVTYNGDPVEACYIELYQFTDVWEHVPVSARSSSNGNYRLEGLQAGTYTLRHYCPSSLGFADGVYEQVAALDAGTPLIVDDEQQIENLDFALKKSATISGTITSTDRNQPLPQVYVTFYQRNGSEWHEAHWSFSGTNGVYTAEDLAPGTYRIGVNVTYGDPRYDATFYPATTDIAAATDIVVTENSTTTGIDIALALTQYNSPEITSARSTANGELTIHYTGTTDQVYVPQISTNLNATWIDCGLPAICDESTNSFSIKEHSPSAFWRLKKLK